MSPSICCCCGSARCNFCCCSDWGTTATAATAVANAAAGAAVVTSAGYATVVATRAAAAPGVVVEAAACFSCLCFRCFSPPPLPVRACHCYYWEWRVAQVTATECMLPAASKAARLFPAFVLATTALKIVVYVHLH